MLYWEFHEQGGKQAVRYGNWKAVRLDVDEKGFHDGIELYNLEKDPFERTNIAKQESQIANKMKNLMLENHSSSDFFLFEFEKE